MARTSTAGTLSAAYTYNADNRVATITYGNGTRTLYTYNDAGQVTAIRHEKADQSLILLLSYGYSADGLITSITESGGPGGWATTTFTYDNRNRLILESRDGLGLYGFGYTYDQGGNRLLKIDYFNNKRTEYHYDTDVDLIDINGDQQLDDPRSFYQTRNNRLMWYEEFDSAEVGTGNVTMRVEYYYGHDEPPIEHSSGTEAGSPTLIVRKLMDPQTHLPTAYHGTSLAYNHQGEVGMMIERTWTESATGGPDCESETLGRGIEFLGNGRTRYGVRQREFVADPYDYWYWSIVEGTTLWSDYDGEEVYGDYTVTATKTWDEQEQVWVYGPPELHNVAAYLPGVGWMRTDPATSETMVYYGHSDHLGTLRAVSDQQSAISGVMVLTAFGEAVCGESAQNPCGTGVPPVGTRYQYAGDWGYESGLGSPGHGGAAGQSALPWQHVGHRWYDPSLGRFLQRDPIGVGGGLNVYRYVGNLPTGAIDPLGLWNPVKWLYTGDGNASDQQFWDSAAAAGELLYEICPLRGGYARVGVGKSRGPQAGVEGRWTMDQGGSVCASLGWQWSRRMRDPRTGRFVSGTGGVGGSVGWSERDGWGGGLYGGLGQNQKGSGVGGGVDSDGLIDIGVDGGIFGGGIVIRLPRW